MLDNLKSIREEAISLIKESNTLKDCENVRIAMLGKKGKVTAVSYTHLTLPTKRIV